MISWNLQIAKAQSWVPAALIASRSTGAKGGITKEEWRAAELTEVCGQCKSRFLSKGFAQAYPRLFRNWPDGRK